MSSPASGSDVRYAIVPETAYAVTPTAPAFHLLRLTSGGLRTNKTTSVSDEINADGNVKDETLVGLDVSGAYNFEFSYGAFDMLLEAALMGAWTGDVLKNARVPHSFTIEEMLPLEVGASYSRFRGVEVEGLNLSLSSREKITGSFDLMGHSETLDAVALTDATYAAANDDPVFSASADVAGVTVTGVSGPIDLKSLTLKVANNLRSRPVVGSLYSLRKGRGRCDVTGTMECYFESNALYQQVLAHGFGALSLPIGSVSGKKYTLSIPKLRFLDGQRTTGGNTDDVMVSVPFRGVLDSATGCSIQMTRAVV